METQHLIKRKISQPPVIDYIKDLLEVNKDMNRTKLSDLVCDKFGFVDKRGKNQTSTCLKALRDLDKRDYIALPAPLTSKGSEWRPRRMDHMVPAPAGVPSEVGAFEHLTLDLVNDENQMRLWNEMMIREHPQGHRPLVGRQVRYLIWSECGWLGAFGFAAPALALRDRDSWIGWDAEARRLYLDRIVCLSRFLIRPSVHCSNLASSVLGQCLRMMPLDFEDRYGYRPYLVESFVDTAPHLGTSFKATNWMRVGKTQGRGRHDSNHKHAETSKDIYLYPLRHDFRKLMGVAKGAGKGPLHPATGLRGKGWVWQEFGAAQLGDKRLTNRLCSIAQVLSDNPGETITTASGGDHVVTQGFYRFIDHPNEALSMDVINASHRDQTIRRMAGQSRVLCIQDSTDLNYGTLEQCAGLGLIGKNEKNTTSGLSLHSTFVTTETGLPLGVLRPTCDAPTFKSDGSAQGEDRKMIPIEEKSSFRWIVHFRDCQEIAKQLPETKILCIMDREADMFDLFHAWRKDQRVDLLVRAKHNRKITGDLKLFDTVLASPVLTRVRVQIPRQRARKATRHKKGRPGYPPRKATLSLRWCQIEIKPDANGLLRKEAPISLWIINAQEENPPLDREESIDWYLLTTLPIVSADDAVQCLKWYTLRWRIEEWHRVLKSGCEIEAAAHKTANRLKRFIGINLVIAWRIMLMTRLSREQPTLPADILFSEEELKVLYVIAAKRKFAKPKTVQKAVHIVSRLGGYLARKSDPPPGDEVIWKGFEKLHYMLIGFRLAYDTL